MEINKKIIMLSLVLLVIGFGIGFLFGLQQSKAKIKELNSQIENVKKFLPNVPELNSIAGAITKIEGNTIFIKVNDFVPDPFKTLPQLRTAIVKDTTKFAQLIMKDNAAFQKDLDIFQKQIQNTSPNSSLLSNLPLPFIMQDINFNELKLGDQIIVSADTNITYKETFDATLIIVQK
ncbi:MAG: hypothetical protein Q8R04_00130 [Nanoarchaeota archaeon]|nr:hypothetical protein [Nanoarchaeota archaeon]